MPTRAEVLQGLKSHDEFQNRDIELVLDYLEQEIGSSSSTRTTLLGAKSRTKDAVTRRDLTAIYNYIAELGSPASSLRDFLNDLVVKRDIVSRDLVDHIMNEVDLATPAFMLDSPIAMQAKVGNMFRSTSGGGAEAGDGEKAQSTQNLGSGASFIPWHSFGLDSRAPQVVIDGLGGRPELTFDGVDDLYNNNLGGAGGPEFPGAGDGITMFWIGRKLRDADDRIMAVYQDNTVIDSMAMGWTAGGDFRFARNGAVFNDIAVATVVAGWAIVGVNAAGTMTYADVSFAAGAVPLATVEVVDIEAITPSGFIDFGTFNNLASSDALGSVSEAYVANRLWTAGEQAQAKAYANNKFGITPL